MWVLKEVFFLENQESFFPRISNRGVIGSACRFLAKNAPERRSSWVLGSALFPRDVGVPHCWRNSRRLCPTLSSRCSRG